MLELLLGIGKKKKLNYEEVQKLVALDGTTGHRFGFNAITSGDGSVLVICATGDSHMGASSGTAYVFTKQANGTYTQSQKLVALDAAQGDNFGCSAAITTDGSVIVVSANGDDDKGAGSGSVYIFTKQVNGNYVQSQKLVAADGADNDQFGTSVSIAADSSVIVVGAMYDDDRGNDSGSVYIFTKQANGNYVQSQKLVAADGADNDHFGTSVAASANGSIVVVGAPYDDARGTYSGSAYVFTKQPNENYVQSQKLLASDGAETDFFGAMLAISADSSVIVVEANRDDDKGNNSGSVYVFTKQANGVYVQSQKLLASDGAAGDSFGYNVAVSGDGSVIVIGSHYDDDKGNNSGSAYVFTKQVNGNYLQSQKFTASDGAANDFFGINVAISDNASVIVVGAYASDNAVPDTGSSYIFRN